MWGRMDFDKQKNQDQRGSRVVGGQGRTRRGPGRTGPEGVGGPVSSQAGQRPEGVEAGAERAEAMERCLQREPERRAE